MGSTLGACGDVNRNVCAPPAPFNARPEYLLAQKAAEDIADLLAPQSGAYYDVWLDGEKFMSSVAESAEVTRVRDDNRFGTNFEGCPEPLYGTQFLPRKFKVAVTVPGDNSVDLFTNDVGLVVLTSSGGQLQGYNVYVGGGMGRAHRNADTFARLAEPLGFVEPGDMLAAVKARAARSDMRGGRNQVVPPPFTHPPTSTLFPLSCRRPSCAPSATTAAATTASRRG